jgi:DNA invertase Pin-like site-specific DNA recombinase
MSVHLFALAVKGRSIATVAAVLVAAMVVITGQAEAVGVSGTPLLAQGAGMGARPSTQVRQVQRALEHRGYDLGDRGVDGRFGPLTAAAVRRLQAQRGLAVDGIVGRHTRTALRLSRGTAASAPSRRTHAERSAAASTRRESTRSQPVITPAATRPNTTATKDRSSNLLGAIVGWGIFAAFVAFALAGLWRWVSRMRRTRADTAHAPKDVSTVSTNGAVDGFAPSLVAPDDPAEVSANWAVNGYAPAPVEPREPVIGYVTTSTDEWSEADEASAAAIEATCERSDWGLFEIVQDRQNGKTLDRPGLRYALEQIACGRARGLVVSDLQRLSRSPDDLGALMAWFRDADARLVALDLDLDTTSPVGREVARTLMALGNAEQGRVQTARNQGADPPVHGRPALKDRPELMERIVAMRSANMTLWQIADQLNAEGIPTLRGGTQWRPSSIQAALGYKRPGPQDRLPALDNRGGNGG